MLLTIADIESQLDEKFSRFQGEMDDLILRKRLEPLKNIRGLEEELNIKLDSEFLSFITEYDLDNFSLGNISFGSGQNYIDTLIKLNSENDFNQWWSGESRPGGIIVVAISDPYAILLNSFNGEIYAITSESDINENEPISVNFELFIRGVGSLFLKHCQPTEVCVSVGARNKDFWNNI
ncbi:nuclease [Trabulsiella odontotermitis]|uniref:nuclease n=1 Tax=Trabulsiella odontotermitis TaxID=379893 RepID=UPI003ACEDA97